MREDQSDRLPPYITFAALQEFGYLKEYRTTGPVMFDTDGRGLSGEGLLCDTHQEYLVGSIGAGFRCPVPDCQTSVIK